MRTRYVKNVGGVDFFVTDDMRAVPVVIVRSWVELEMSRGSSLTEAWARIAETLRISVEEVIECLSARDISNV